MVNAMIYFFYSLWNSCNVSR